PRRRSNLKLVRSQRRAVRVRPAGRHRGHVTRWWCRHRDRLSRRRCRMTRGRVICLWLALNLSIGGWREAEPLLHSVIVVIGKFLTDFAARDVMTILGLRNALRVRHKSRIRLAPALDSFWQVCNCFLKCWLPLFLRLLLLSGSGLSDDCFRLLHFSQ